VTFVGESPTAGPVPVPERETLCGLPKALSVIERDAIRDPAADGVNVTLIVHLEPEAKLVLQLFVCEKSLAFVPLTATPVIVRAAFPVLLRVTL